VFNDAAFNENCARRLRARKSTKNTFFRQKIKYNEGKSVARFWRQVAAWLPDMFCNFCLVNNHKIAKNSTTPKAREKVSTDLES